MSDTPPERNSNSKSNLIEVQHVGVTAKLQSPLKGLLQNASSTETENDQLLFHPTQNNKTKYNKFSNDSPGETENSTTDASKILYEMRALRNCNNANGQHTGKLTPSKIEFQLYRKPTQRKLRRNTKIAAASKPRKTSKRKLFDVESVRNEHQHCKSQAAAPSFFQRLRCSLENIRTRSTTRMGPPTGGNIFDDLPEPPPLHGADSTHQRAPETRIGIYPFDHGSADYLRTTDCHPQLVSVLLAERATQCATRFWAEIFGSLHIGVTFAVTFVLQTYRFLLYSLVNTLLVGVLHMTSDYLIKPLLTVLFNGFLQPPLIFVFNVLSSVRDILLPIADALNSFMRPVATVGRSLRLVHATYNNKPLAKEV